MKKNGVSTGLVRAACGAGGRIVRAAAAAVALVSLLAVTSGQARAADDGAKAAAKVKLEEGARLMDAGDYEQALADFEAAYKLVQNPKILFNVGLANVGLARYPEAIRAFERFMDEAKTAPSTAISEAQKQIDSLRNKVASVEVKAAEPGVEIIIDGRSQGRTPLTLRIYVEPGQHQLMAQKSEGSPPAVQVFKVTGGEHQTLRVVLPDLTPAAAAAGGGASSGGSPTLVTAPGDSASPSSDTGVERPVYKKGWFWGVVAAGAVAAGVTVYMLAGRSPSYPSASLGTVPGP